MAFASRLPAFPGLRRKRRDAGQDPVKSRVHRPRGTCECGYVGAITKRGAIHSHGDRRDPSGKSVCYGRWVP